MRMEVGRYTVKLADTDEEIAAAQRLRYRVFVEEMGAIASPFEAADRRERDRFDPYFEHMLLIDNQAGAADPDERVIGVYRLMRGSVAKAGIGFYGACEYDLGKIRAYRGETLELGRSCVSLDARGGAAMQLLWMGLGRYVVEHDIGVLFGTASFPGVDLQALAQPLSFLYCNHLAPEDLRVRTLPRRYVSMDMLLPDVIDRARALREIPALIKGYLRLGGFVGDGAYVDPNFNTVDVCLVMDTQRMAGRYKDFYAKQAPDALARILG